ncbi:MAG: hypothetical protein Fur0039_13650 [Rhodocyclaceae bacterium]
MALGELQIGLLALGAAAVAGVLAYNRWQERRFRREAERAFDAQPADALLAAEPAGRRVEPTLTAVAPAGPEPAAPLPASPEFDPGFECLVRLDAGEPVAAAEFARSAAERLGAIEGRIRWYAWSGGEGAGWLPLDEAGSRECRSFAGILQLANRSGPVSPDEAQALAAGVAALGDRYLGVAQLPEIPDLAEKAAALDRFCAGVDVQIGVNLVSRKSEGMPGSKLRGLAEAAGLTLREDGLFHALDETGETRYTMGNLEPARFAAQEMKTLVTRAVSFSLDVPRVADAVACFDAMLAVARKLGEVLDARLVDDKRQELTERSLDVIRRTIEQYQAQMRLHGVEPGSPGACRLFS